METETPGLAPAGDLSAEEYREYEWFVPETGGQSTYRINNPKALYFRPGGTTHRILDVNGVVHCVPAPGHFGCVLRWKNKEGFPPVQF